MRSLILLCLPFFCLIIRLKLFTLPRLLTSYLPSYPVIDFQISFSFIEYHFLILNRGCFCYLYNCILPCFNQRLPVIFIGLVILFPFPSISSTFGKIIPILVCHIYSSFLIFKDVACFNFFTHFHKLPYVLYFGYI